MSKKIDLIEVMNGKQIFSIYTNKLVTFVDEITEEMCEIETGVYSDGMTLIDVEGEAEKDIAGMYCKMKDGSIYNMEDFYAVYGAFDSASKFAKNVINLIADR